MSQVLPKPTPLTDPHDILIQGCKENDLHSQEQLYRQFYPQMIKICQRYAGDVDGAGIIFNNAMMRVFRHVKNYRHEGKLGVWIKTIVINCALDHIKSTGRLKETPITIITEEIPIADYVFEKISAKEIQLAIKELPKATATVFNLFVYEGFTHKQIGEALGISDGTSKWHVNEGRKLLKTKLERLMKTKV